MAARPSAVPPGPPRMLKALPTIVAGLILLPLAAGLIATIAPGLAEPEGMRALWAWPGLGKAVALSLWTGLASTALALTLCLGLLAFWRETRGFAWAEHALAPLLALPHAAAALGLAFLIAPSGWIARALSPWATGWQVPPDVLIPGDPWGLALALGLVAKEVPFLLLVALAALPRSGAEAALRQARVMGYGNGAAFALVVWPDLYPRMRLAVLAVLAYGMTSVDMSLVLGPSLPPTLAQQIALWSARPEDEARLLASAGAAVQLALVLAALILWRGGERLGLALVRVLAGRGQRLRGADRLRGGVAALGLGLSLTLVGAILALAVWSLAGQWSFPAAWPESLDLAVWRGALPDLARLSGVTLALAFASGLMALALSLGLLQAEFLWNIRAVPPTLLYLPLILPQVAVLPGLQVLALRAGLPGGAAAVVLAHLIFVLPYVYFTLAGPFRSWDARIATLGATLGAGPGRIFWRLRLPMLAGPVAAALAVGMAVSVGQYLPTLMIGGGRIATLTTEALALAAGGNRRLTSAHALLQALWPMLGFALAIALPPLIWRMSLARGVR